ncbi:MAG: hypothetical protein M1825_004843 [Sarcosagium campestre]|nr:MAG: hypothetical protein M1825_004843 [Sarcosagium campestre]
MTLLDTHLEQISLSSATIAQLPFLPPKMFTNALLHNHDITTLIRDTEAHERALFSVQPTPPPTARDPSKATRRTTMIGKIPNDAYGNQSGGSIAPPRRDTAVAAVLGGDMIEQIRHGGGGGIGSTHSFAGGEPRERTEIDVDVLLKGAEKLPIPDAIERITTLRARFGQLEASIEHNTTKVAQHTLQLESLTKPRTTSAIYDEEQKRELIPPVRSNFDEDVEATVEDLGREEDEIRKLEEKKKALEDRLRGMEQDLGRLLR